MSTNPLNDISKVYLEQIATEAFVDPEQGEAPSGRSPLQNVSDHPNPLVRKKAVKAFKKQMGKEYGGTWKSRSKDPVAESTVGDRARSAVADDRLSSEQEKTSASMDKLRAQTKRHEKSTALARTQARIAAKKSEDTARAMHPKPGVSGYRIEETQIDEKVLTAAETKKKEEIVKSMKDKAADFEKRYPGRGKEVMYATATKMAKKVAEQAMELQPKTQATTTQSTQDPKARAAALKAKQAAVALKTKELATLRQTPAGTAVSTFG